MRKSIEGGKKHKSSPKRMRVTIRVGILTFFMTIFLTFSLTIVFIISYSFYNNSVSLTKQVIQAISNSVLREVSTDLNPALSSSSLSGRLIAENTLDRHSVPHMMSYTLNTLTVLPQAQMVYWGDEEGNFVISRREPDGSLSSEIIDYRVTPHKREYIYRDKSGNISIVKPIDNFDYDPRKRPWYLIAKEQKESVWTEAYLFYSGKEKTLGITSTTPAYVDDKLVGVFGIDVSLESISHFLSKQKITENGEAYIINDKGEIIASPSGGFQLKNVDTLVDKPWIAKAFKEAKTHDSSAFVFSVHGVNYVAATYSIPGFERQGWKIFILLPENDVIGPVIQANFRTLVFCSLLLVLGLILISFFSKRISVPIKKLAKDIERIKMFNIKTETIVDSRIKEVHDMSSAIHAMKIGLQSFQKYVPQQLVRKLISSGEAAKLGGRNRRVTLFFSDIDDFTSIAEKVGDDEIMIQMCEYFDIFDENIQDTAGTVDKFIGDAIMAFWGAPERDDLQVFHACSCALNCQRAIHHLNDKWKSEKKMPFPTRIGIHSGEVVVGNLGSRNRLNYTAIGDTVNTTSRLEQINKIYGTRIIVSADAYERVKNEFIFRKLDDVIVKGRAKSLGIYELLDFKNIETENVHTDLIERFAKAHEYYENATWDKALELFKALQTDYPNDKPIRLFIERCLFFKENPHELEKDWHGVWKYTQK